MQPGRGLRPIADLVDELLASEKTLAGAPLWRSGTRDHDQRLIWTVLVAGESSSCSLQATSYPDEDPSRFTIALIFRDRCVWRLDHEPENRAPHHNPIQRAPLLGNVFVVRGPHYHAWSDNRYLATPNALPKELPCAREQPRQAGGWENSFRWFCGATGIEQPLEIPALPPRRRLV